VPHGEIYPLIMAVGTILTEDSAVGEIRESGRLYLKN
jgi:hypothetical protein